MNYFQTKIHKTLSLLTQSSTLCAPIHIALSRGGRIRLCYVYTTLEGKLFVQTQSFQSISPINEYLQDSITNQSKVCFSPPHRNLIAHSNAICSKLYRQEIWPRKNPFVSGGFCQYVGVLQFGERRGEHITFIYVVVNY